MFEEILRKQTELLEMLIQSQGVQKSRGGHYRNADVDPKPILTGQARSKVNSLTIGEVDTITRHVPLYDGQGIYSGFFQDCALENSLLNLLIHPTPGIAADIPIRPNNNITERHGFLTRYNVEDDVTNPEPSGPCDPCIVIIGDMDFCKMEYPYGELCRTIHTIDITQLILRACANQYSDFFIVGDYRGVSATPALGNFRDPDLIRAGAVQRKLAELATVFQRWVTKNVWVGDPANNPVGASKASFFYGLLRLINGDYPNSGLPLFTPFTSKANCSALNSYVADAGGAIVGDGTFSLYQSLQAMEQTLFLRAQLTGVNPVDWKFYMISPLWLELTKHLACEMAADGCTVPSQDIDKVLNMNDGGVALYNMTTRNAMRESMSLTLNGRTYPVVLDDTIPYTLGAGAGNTQKYTSSIFMIPFSVAGGDPVLWWEYVDYSQIYNELADLTANVDVDGWTDGGQYWHQLSQVRNCIEIQSQMQLRLIFKAPHLAGRIDTLAAQSVDKYPMFYDGAGAQTGFLATASVKTET